MKSILTLGLLTALAATAATQANIWSASRGTGRIMAHDPAGHLVLTTLTPISSLALPAGIAVSPTGEAYVAFQGQGSLDSGVYHLDATGTVSTFYPFGTDVTGLAPTYQLSPGARCDKASGATNDFSDPVTYTVVSFDGLMTNVYTVTAAVTPASTEKEMLTFAVPDLFPYYTGVIIGTEI